MTEHFKLVSVETSDEYVLDKCETLIGRSNDCDIVLKVGYPSRQHAMIIIDNATVSIQDLGSTNGTYINNHRIKSIASLQDGDVVRFDSCAYHLVKPNSDNTTVMMSRLKPSNALEEESSVVIHDGFVGTENTAFRSGFPLPTNWTIAEREQHRNAERKDRYPRALVDNMIAQGLKSEVKPSAVLVVLSGHLESRIIALTQKSQQQQWTIGREPSCLIHFSDSSISSRHACLFYNKGSWGINDEGSRNGIAINDVITKQQRLLDGDLIKLGQLELIFREL